MPDFSVESLRLAIVGVGWAGSRHAEAIVELGQRVQKVEIACFVDTDADHLNYAADCFGVAARHATLDDALADPTVDAVDIATPHGLHRPMAIAAAEAGKDVLVEKPVALTVDDATAMIEAAAANGVRLFVAENEAYEARIEFLSRVVQSREPIGPITHASVAAGFRADGAYGYPGRRAWLAEPEQGGTGTWMLHGIHTLAGLRRVFGEVRTVYVREHKSESFQRPELEGTMTGLLTLESGVSVSIAQSAETRFHANTGGYLLHGEAGSIRGLADGYELFMEGEDASLRPYPGCGLSSYARELEAFADYVAGDESQPTTGISERRTLAIVQAGYESAESGLPVDLRERFGPI